mmetsp:Transcript_13546/g.40339  ORF Transcript_13546/g.40339 Transcript_13546/m.40339 type:complete len:275 (+) Transcript_13546:195-1019(+)
MVRVEPHQLSAACTVQQENPKKGVSAQRYDRYKAATTLGEILDLGGSRGDIGNDLVRGYIQIEDEAVALAILSTVNDSEKRRLPESLRAKLPDAPEPEPLGPRPAKRPKPAAEAPPPEPRRPRPKKVKTIRGYILYSKVSTQFTSWDPRAFEGLTEPEADMVKGEALANAQLRDGTRVDSSILYADADAANAAALNLITRLVQDCARDNADGAVRLAEDAFLPSENTLRNSCSSADHGALFYSTRVELVVDSQGRGLENRALTQIQCKAIYQQG